MWNDVRTTIFLLIFTWIIVNILYLPGDASRDGILRERREHARGRNWQIAEGFVEVPVNLLVQLKKCGKNIPND